MPKNRRDKFSDRNKRRDSCHYSRKYLLCCVSCSIDALTYTKKKQTDTEKRVIRQEVADLDLGYKVRLSL